ncbi:MAG: hypothetical protein WA477_04680, partial [Candidatus Sulfotelmatobacter sp.]
ESLLPLAGINDFPAFGEVGPRFVFVEFHTGFPPRRRAELLNVASEKMSGAGYTPPEPARRKLGHFPKNLALQKS